MAIKPFNFDDQFKGNYGPMIPTGPPEWVMPKFDKVLTLGPETFRATVWDGVLDPPEDEDVIGLDTETHLIEGNGHVPDVVIGQFYFPKARLSLIVPWWHLSDFMGRLYKRSIKPKYILHNGSFDFYVLGGKNCYALFDAVVKGNYVDTGIRYLLWKMGRGEWETDKIPWNLAYVIEQFYGIALPKDDAIRLTFSRERPLTEEQFDYAALDPVAAYLVYKAIPEQQPTEDLQCKSSVVLAAIEHRGMLVDMPRRKELQAGLLKKMEEASTTIEIFGLPKSVNDKKVTGKQAVLQQLLHNIELRTGLTFPRTAGSDKRPPMISTSSGLIEMFPEGAHPLLSALKKYNHAQKLLVTFLNDEHIMKDGRTHSKSIGFAN